MAIDLEWAGKDCTQCKDYMPIEELVPDADIYFVCMYCKRFAETKPTTHACPYHNQRN